MHLNGTKKQVISNGTMTNSTIWDGIVQGKFQLGTNGASLMASASVAFNSEEGVKALQVSAAFSSQYVDIEFDINYQNVVNCSDVTYVYGVFDPNDVNSYYGGFGSGSVHIKSIYF